LDEVSQSPNIVLQTLRRELQEELGLAAKEVQPVGLVIDQSSMQASRHVGVVYEVSAAGMLVTSAAEEFSLRSKFTGRYFTPQELVHFRRVFDPWSRIVFDDWIAPRNNVSLGDQPPLPFWEHRW
jgi:predicted NUDIX family phosphoesterase